MAKHTLSTILNTILILLLIANTTYAEFVLTSEAENNTPNAENYDYIISLDSNYVVKNYNIIKDFIFSSNNKKINMCACSTFADAITIENIGNVKESYKIFSDKKYSVLTSNTAFLEPGEKAAIINYVKPGCKELSEDMKTTAISTSKKTLEMTQTVNSVFCSNIEAAPINTLINTKPCSISAAAINVKNPLDFLEYYYFETDILNDYAAFSYNPLVLGPKQSADVLIYFNPTCDVYGEFEGNIIINTKNTKLNAEIPLLVNISQKYDYKVNLPDYLEACNYIETRFPITIENQENFTNTYNLNIPRSKWFKLENKTVQIQGNSKKTVYLSAYPKWAQASAAEFELKTVSKLGDVKQINNLTIYVTDCYTFELSMNSDKNICSDDNEITFLLKNKGTKDSTFDIGYSGDKITDFKHAKQDLESQETAKIPITINLTDASQTSKFKLNASLFEGAFVKEQNIKLNVKSLEECYQTKIVVPKIKSGYNLAEYEITAENKGRKKAEYDVMLESMPWANINTIFLSLNPGEKDRLILTVNPNKTTKKGIYNASLRLTEINSGIEYKKDFDITIFEKNIENSMYSLAKSLIKTFLKIILLPILIGVLAGLGMVFAIKYYNSKKHKRKKIVVKK